MAKPTLLRIALLPLLLAAAITVPGSAVAQMREQAPAPVPTPSNGEGSREIPPTRCPAGGCGTVHSAAFTAYGNALMAQVRGVLKRESAQLAQVLVFPQTWRVVLGVTVLAGGALDKVEVLQSSGNVAMDEYFLELTRRAAPFDALPYEVAVNGRAFITTQWTYAPAAAGRPATVSSQLL